MGGSTIKINYFNNKKRSNFCLVANHSMTMAHSQFDCYDGTSNRKQGNNSLHPMNMKRKMKVINTKNNSHEVSNCCRYFLN